MKLAFINGVNNIDNTLKTGYYLILPHLQKYYSYLKFFKEIEGYKILDNSLIELGESVDLNYLMDSAVIFDVNEVVLPDVFNQGKDSCVVSLNSLEKVLPRKYYFNYQVVCHGKTFKEWCYSWDLLSKIKEIHCISIPKIADFNFGRKLAIEYALNNNPLNKEIHLLGVWSSWSEILTLPKEYKEKIRGCDTSLAYHFACDNIAGLDFNYKPAYKVNLENKNSVDKTLLLRNQQFIFNQL